MKITLSDKLPETAGWYWATFCDGKVPQPTMYFPGPGFPGGFRWGPAIEIPEVDDSPERKPE